ncbi:IclR family transcriptional regulator [Mycolicibacterium sp. XJ870]
MSEAGNSDGSKSDFRPTRTLLRGLAVLEFIAEHRSRAVSTTEIAEGIGLDRATTIRLVSTLREAGYLVQDRAAKGYQVSSKLIRLAERAGIDVDVKVVARPALMRLRDMYDESVHLGVLEEDHVVYVDKQESGQSIRLVSAIGQQMPLTTTSLGKAILSSVDAETRDVILDRLEYVKRTPQSITDRTAFLHELRLTTERGFAIESAENEDGVTCVGAAIKLANGDVVAAISVSGPTFRMEPKLARVGEDCRRIAEEIAMSVAAIAPA